MINEDTRIIDKGDGRVALKTDITTSNLAQLALAKFLRGLAPSERDFFKGCKVVGFVPVYMPKGMFAGDNMHVHKMDPDQLDYALRALPEFRATEEMPEALPQYFDMGKDSGGSSGSAPASAAVVAQ